MTTCRWYGVLCEGQIVYLARRKAAANFARIALLGSNASDGKVIPVRIAYDETLGKPGAKRGRKG